MGIRLKLLAPLLLLLILLLAGFRFVIWPQILQEQLLEQVVEEKKTIEILGSALIHPLRNSDLAQLYSILENVMKKHKEWLHINLYDMEGIRLYPLANRQIAAGKEQITLQHTIYFVSIPVANMSVIINLTPIHERHNQFVSQSEVLIFLILFIVLVISVVFQEKLITVPLKTLSAAAQQMAKGNYDVHLTKAGVDEVGLLIQSFDHMRKEVESSQKKLHDLAHHDPLTGLPNRIMFQDRLEHAIALAHRAKGRLGLMLIDMDNFKSINDTLGHATGDNLLASSTKRLTEIMREGDTLARLGGDEFMIILENIKNPDEVKFAAEKIIDAFHHPLTAEEHNIPVSLSIGITLYPDDTTELSSLVQNADIAMYRVKAAGGAGYSFFSDGTNTHVDSGIEMRSKLYYALEKNQYFLEYQPRIDLSTGKINCVEALIRWQDPERGIVNPVDFIPLLEQTGLIIDVSEWVFQESCRFIRYQIDAGKDVTRVSVNLSARQFRDPLLLIKIQNALQLYEIPAQYIELELTEGVVIENTLAAIKVMDRLHAMGVGLSIDDFGTGYSSLSYLKRFPVDYLKIDKSFVSSLPGDKEDAAIVKAIIALSKSLKIEAVAEGVETEEQLQFLKLEGCEYVQGFYYSRPLIDAEVIRLIEQKQWSVA